MMTYDFPTLFSVTVFVSAVAGLLLLFAWLQNRSIVSLGMWGSAFLMNAVAMHMLLAQIKMPDSWWPVCLGDALWLTAHGLMWTAARAFEGRRTPLAATLAGAVIWLVACQFDGFFASLQARMTLVSATIGTYVLLCACEVWRGRDPELVSRWPAIVLLIAHGAVFWLRVLLAGVLPYPSGVQPASPNWLPIGTFEVLFHIVCMSVLLVNMAKERAELQQRNASQIDPLTGVANRRAFLDRGEDMLQRMQAEGRTASLLLFDIDRFKAINDTHGHLVGDEVLSAFCRLTQSMLRPDDLFGRFGGEEFACLLPDTSLAEATFIAERIRSALAGVRLVSDTPNPVTVSVGVAITSDANTSLTPLFMAADRALYRAKAKGRNRVEAPRAPLLLVEHTNLASA
jgi:diguanylate cyclase (GGDEF)-like protein